MIVKNRKSGKWYGIRETGKYGISGKEYALTNPNEEDWGKVIRKITEEDLKEKFVTPLEKNG